MIKGKNCENMSVKTYHPSNEEKSLLYGPRKKMSVLYLSSSEQLLLTSYELANLFCGQLLAIIFISDLAIQVKSLHFINFVLVLALTLI